jgi:hypothetical protein
LSSLVQSWRLVAGEWLKSRREEKKILKHRRTLIEKQETQNETRLFATRDREPKRIRIHSLVSMLQLKCNPDVWLHTMPSLARLSDR